MKRPAYEPSSDMRSYAALLYDMYQGLVQAGFTDSQALGIIGQTIAANVIGGSES